MWRWRLTSTQRRLGIWAGTAAGIALAILGGWQVMRRPSARAESHSGAANVEPQSGTLGTVRLQPDQQQSIGLRTELVVIGPSDQVLEAAGRITPNENHYAFITPRVSGIARQVVARIGQEVRAGDLLALIDSAEVAQARFDLITRAQELELARIRGRWQETIYEATQQLVERIKQGDTPEELHERFQDRPLGANREKLIGAYARYRLAKSTVERNKLLITGTPSVPLRQYQQSLAEFEAALATYQSLMDSLGFEAKLANNVAQQELRQAETAVRVARERLRVLGVNADGSQPQIEDGRVLGALDPASDEPADAETLLSPRESGPSPLMSSYALWAPFNGTVLDRSALVPGVAVDKEHQLFTIADLATVWIEVHVQESDFSRLAGSREGRVSFTSPAYPQRTFEGTVIYSGDLVDEKTRSILLLARADNPERLLKPGMFVNVKIISPAQSDTLRVPTAALLTEDALNFVFVQTGDETFERRDVMVAERPTGGHEDGRVAITGNLREGDRVVVAGGFKLKSEAFRLTATD